MDETDISLIRALQKDSRRSLKELADLADISVPTARARLDRLVNSGVIRQFTVSLNPQKLVGGMTAFIHMKARLSDVEAIKAALSEMDEVMALYLTAGECDLVVRVCISDARALEDFILKKLSKVPGIESARSSVVVETTKEEYGAYIRPGFGIRVFCATCRKEIQDRPVKRVLEGIEYYFCCETCLSAYEQFLRKRAAGEPAELPVPKSHSH